MVERDGNWIESYGPDSWLMRGRGATVQLDHDTDPVGSVDMVVAARDGWWHAEMHVDNPDAKTRERLRPGVPVSLGAQMLTADEDIDLRLRRHTLAELEHIAIVPRGQVGVFPGAKITGVTESKLRDALTQTQVKPKPATAVGWKEKLPPGWEFMRDIPGYELEPENELFDHQTGGGYRWDGERYVKFSGKRLAV